MFWNRLFSRRQSGTTTSTKRKPRVKVAERNRFIPSLDVLESRMNPGSVSPNAVIADWAPGTLNVTVFYTGGDKPVSGTVFIGRAGVLVDGVDGKADHPKTALDTSSNNLDGQGTYGGTGAPYTGIVLATGPSTFTFHYTDASVQAALDTAYGPSPSHAGVLDAKPTDVCVVMYHDSVGTLSGDHANHFSTGTTVVNGSTKSYNTDNSWDNHGDSYTPSGSTYNPCTLSADTFSNPDLSKVGDPEFIITSAKNTSESPIYLKALSDSLGNNLLAAPVAPMTSITATLTPAGGSASPVTLKAGQVIPVGATLTVKETRIVQASDPDPTNVNVTYTFNALANGSSPVNLTVVATDQVNLFQPHVTETLSVDKATANLGDTLTYTVGILNDSSSDSPNLVFKSITFGIQPQAGFVLPTWLTDPNGIAPGYSNSFAYTHVVTSSDFVKDTSPGTHPFYKPITNTVDVHFNPAPTGLHTGANAFKNDIHGPTNTVSTTPIPQTDLAVTKVSDKDTVNGKIWAQGSAVPGTQITYTITVKNTGGATVNSVILQDFLPPGLLNASFTPSTGNYTPQTGLWNGLNLAAGQSITMTLKGTIDPSACGIFTNTVKVLPPDGFVDPDPSNNVYGSSDTLTPQSDLAVLVNNDGTSTVSAGDTRTYNIVLTNNGPSTATAMPFHDLISGYLASFNWTASASGGSSVAQTSGSGGAINGTGDMIDTYVTLLPGGTATFTLTVVTSSANNVNLQNTAVVAAPPGDNTQSNNIITDIDTLV